MATPVEVSRVKRGSADGPGIKGLGGTWRDRPWYMSERYLIWEIERPDSERQWDFFATADGMHVPIVVTSDNGRKYLLVGTVDVAGVAGL